ncbi:YciI family protein [Donghicola eburneus]|uniref:YCII-related domain-containing protein n=1 Tax=Donghicola eburneus TaxID=393278 RepID=A0A1M4MZC4_9RHOB|nr:YciI family protein [Donghicola eburneus]SCM67104.1 hypothetical protein KARMA_1291 [Donghicola eburneus]SFQ71990.1 YCII-related domain-containing protein [Donghicola eburneus]
MAKFLYGYHGGKMPETEAEEQASIAAWVAWVTKYEASMPDPGNPVGQSKTVSASGISDDGGANPLSGYAIIEAANIDEATAIANECPIIGEGGSVEVAQIMEM